MAAFARDRVDEWLPPDNTYCQGVLRQWGMGPLEWSRNGQSYSCSMCGSMSVEELLECLDGPEIEFSINDHGNKVYVRRYSHAGDCPPVDDNSECFCDVRRGGGPIKFYLRHMRDGGRSEEEQLGIYSRVKVANVRSWERLTKSMGVNPDA
ncbi:hypothetical protein LCGC14_1126170 [marine sediment metagenome]|uniref:Uncharacterized protein n=1 Tax=marine sediment metagenome TaxID=412755 RepID=A0A0F9MQG5_9ZZZZ